MRQPLKLLVPPCVEAHPVGQLVQHDCSLARHQVIELRLRQQREAGCYIRTQCFYVLACKKKNLLRFSARPRACSEGISLAESNKMGGTWVACAQLLQS